MVSHTSAQNSNNEPKPKADLLIEVSWEVCNKVGGIYTVIMSKAAQVVHHYKDNYIVIGPYFIRKIAGEFEESVPDESMKKMFDELATEGIICHFGKWLVKGEPTAILIDFHGCREKINDVKKQMWDNFKIDSLNSPPDFDEPVAWSCSVGRVIEKLAQFHPEKKVVAHFHEWLAGAGLLHLKKSGANVATVFTTHATILGRSIASNKQLYEIIDQVDPDKEAYNYFIQSKFQLERASARNADVFTTVSEITGMEAEKLLGRKPEVLLPNGLDLEKFPSFEEASVKHKEYKFRIKEHIIYHFFPHYSVDIDNLLIYFIFARYEYQNKGIDLFIQSLAKLNEQLKAENSEKQVFAFFFIPANVKSIKYELIESKRFYEDIKETVDSNITDIRNNLIINLVSQNPLDRKHLFNDDFMTETKKKVLRFLRSGNPLISTHDLFDEGNDAILSGLRSANLNNSESDNVKVVFYPAYLSGADGLLDLSYYETILGCHLGVFPSIYEPWGYTPLEAGALGVASVTSDLSGFGRYITKIRPQDFHRDDCEQESCNVQEESGVFVARIGGKPWEQRVQELFNILHHYASLSKEQRAEFKLESRRLAGLADWKNLFTHYISAHNAAVDAHYR